VSAEVFFVAGRNTIARNKAGRRWGFEFSSLKPWQVAALQTACRVLGMKEGRD